MTESHRHVPRIIDCEPPELVVHDSEQPCPYLEDRVARLPLRLPSRPLTQQELDIRLEGGDRRQGYVLYRPGCPNCKGCEPIRLRVHEVTPNRTQRRMIARAQRELTVTIGPPVADDARVRLYNEHKKLRGLSDGQPQIEMAGYRDFLVASCCDSFEISFFRGADLIGVSICDRSERALSAVYCCFNEVGAKYGVGTLSILKQLALCDEWSLPYLYLGLYIGGCSKMAYKARWLPHERLIDGKWGRFEKKAPEQSSEASFDQE